MNKRRVLCISCLIAIAVASLAVSQPLIFKTMLDAFTNTALAQTQDDERKAKVHSPNGLKPIPPDLQIPARGETVSSIGTLLEGKSAPEHVTYNEVFRHLKELNKQADEEEKKGKDAKHLRRLYKHLAKLDDAQAVILDQVAADTNRDVERLNAAAQKIIKAFREKHKDKKRIDLPAPPPELMVLSQERKQTVLRARDRLRHSIGEEAFDKFDKFVKERVTPSLYQIELKKQAQQQASSPLQNQKESTATSRRRGREDRRKSKIEDGGIAQPNLLAPPGDCYFDCYGGCYYANIYVSSLTWHDGQYVYGYAYTEMDYCAGLYYDPAVYSRFVEGNYQQENTRLLAQGYAEGYADSHPAAVHFRYAHPIGNEYYNTDSIHYVLDAYDGGRQVIAHTAYTIRFPPPPDQCQPGQSFAPNGNPCPTPSPSPSPSPTPNPTPTPESITLTVDAGPDRYIRPAETGGISTAPVTVTVSPASVRSVTLTLEVAAGSGGHIDAAHVGGNVERPKGTFDRERATLRGMTDTSGVFRTTYRASIFSGRTKIKVTSGNLITDVILDVKVPDLVELFEGNNYNLIGFAGIAAHPEGTNHWGTADANRGLREIADAYAAKFYPNPNEPIPENKKLHYNDQSLPQGGKFDVDIRWSLAHRNHDEHRVGINCDVRCCADPGDVPTDRWEELNAIFRRAGSSDTNDETKKTQPHWHLRFEFGENIPNGFASNVTSFVPNVSWATLDRNLSDADWSYWTGRLETAQAQGYSQTLAVAKEFERSMFQSAEYVNRNRSDADYVTDLHVGYWMREPTTAEHEQSLNRLRGDNAQGLNGREILRQNFENSQGFANAVGTLEGTYVPPSCDAVQEQDCYNNGGSWDSSTCDCTYINPEPYPDPCWNGSYYTCE